MHPIFRRGPTYCTSLDLGYRLPRPRAVLRHYSTVMMVNLLRPIYRDVFGIHFCLKHKGRRKRRRKPEHDAGIYQTSTLTPLSKSSSRQWSCMTKVTVIIIHNSSSSCSSSSSSAPPWHCCSLLGLIECVLSSCSHDLWRSVLL